MKKIKDTSEVKIPKRIIDKVIGQDRGVRLIKKAAAQRRNVLLIGDPGTGKSMLAQAMAELLPVEKLEDILIFPNINDENSPKVMITPAGHGKKLVDDAKKKNFLEQGKDSQFSMTPMLIMSLIYTLAIAAAIYFKLFTDILLAAFIIVGGLFLGFMIMASVAAVSLKGVKLPGMKTKVTIPKLLVNNKGKKIAPYMDATGARAGALLGDVKHDPYQSGGLGTPPHLRVDAGMIHKANKGVLYIDEVATLSPKSQQELLTAMQDKRYSISGQSEMSSGAMVHTELVPCDFLLIASGNLIDLQKMHPALRSRIRGYGYEVYLNSKIEDNAKNREKVIQFVAQEVVKDGKIPHFKMEAVDEIIFEARRRASSKNKLTLHFRDLGGLIRAAGDVARTKKHKLVTRDDVFEAKKLAKTLEQQMADQVIEVKKEYEVIKTTGSAIGRVNGLAVMGGREGFGGMLLPIEAAVTPAQSLKAGKTIATGKLGEIAREAVQNVFAIIKKYKGKGISAYDVHVQFLQTHEGVEGDSASVSIATAVVSALEKIPIDQKVAMTGSLSVKGEVLPVGGISAKIEAAIEADAKIVIIPEANKFDVVLDAKNKKKIKIKTADNLVDVLKIALKDSAKKKTLIKEIKKVIN